MKRKRGPTKRKSAHSQTVVFAGTDRMSALTLGVDGGGTKTQAVIMDSAGKVLGEGRAGASNPLRVGVAAAAAAIREAVDKACDAAHALASDIGAAEIGLAGARREDVRASMHETLTESLGIELIEVVTDADIALYGATNGEPGMVIIAGTGSISCALNRKGERACMGGWGPVAGDEGSGSWIARRALQQVAHAADGRTPETTLVKAACEYFNVDRPYDLLVALYAPTMTNSRIAGFSRSVIEEAKNKDKTARAVVAAAGRELGELAVSLVRRLQMQREQFSLATVGGVFAAGALVLNPLKREVERITPRALFTEPLMPPAVAAAHMARRKLLKPLALAS